MLKILCKRVTLYAIYKSYIKSQASTVFICHYQRSLMSNLIQLNEKDWWSAVNNACKILQHNGIIAVPTDTVYGVATLAQSTTAMRRLYEVKGRNFAKPVAISVATVKDVYRWANVTITDSLLHELLPGPVTVVFERTALLNPELNPGTSLVGVRVPDSGFICDVARQCGEPLALTSANVSSQPSSVAVEEFEELWPKLDGIFNAGILSTSELSKKGSTVVDLSKKGYFTIIRDGSALNATRNKLEKYGLHEELKQ